jgi:ornithine cyclodeaminase/alanine dehydrogenase
MAEQLLYLSREDVKAHGITPAEAREAVLGIIREHAAGLTRSLPKSTLALGPGHAFQAMTAASPSRGIATVKWVASAPVAPGSAMPGTSALICASDYRTGAPVAVLDGDEITLIRTAALSAAAASLMAPLDPRVIGFVGCGLQAHAHLAAFLDLYPSLGLTLLLGRSRSSAERLAATASARGLATEIVDHPGSLLARSDIVITTVPAAPGLKPFLDACLMKPAAFASAVDLGRSWMPEALTGFNHLVTDSLEQSQAPYDVDGNPVTTVSFQTDLVGLAGAGHRIAQPSRSLFCFRGLAIADLALAHIVLSRARRLGIGTSLPR